MRRWSLLAVAALACIATPAWAAPRRPAPRRAATSQPASPRVTIRDLLHRELGTLRRIVKEREKLRRVQVGKRVARGEMRRLGAVLGEIRRRRQGVDKALAQRQKRVRLRVRALYRLVRGTARLPLLDPRRASASRDGRATLLRILKRDLAEVRHLRSEQIRLETAVAETKQRRKQAIAVLRDLDRRRDEIQARVARCRQELAGLRHRRRNHRGHAREWNREAYGLEKKIVALHLRLQRQVTTFAALKGKLVRPVPGMIVRWYGESRVTGTKVMAASRGVEISALPRWKVRAPADGTVRFVGRVPTFGNVVLVDHDEGYLTVVGYLGAVHVKVGAQVRQGRPIASLPAARGRRAMKVYLELRRSGRAIDPTPWIQGGLAELRKRGPKRSSRSRRAPSNAVADHDAP